MKALKTVGDAVQRLKDREDLRRILIHRAAHVGVVGRHGRRTPVTEKERDHKAKVERDLKDVESDIRDLKRRELAVA